MADPSNQEILEILLKDLASNPAAKITVALQGVTKAGDGALGKLTELNSALELSRKAFDLLTEGTEALLEQFDYINDLQDVVGLKEGDEGIKRMDGLVASLKDVGIASADAYGIAKELSREFDTKSAKQLALVIADVRGNLRLSAAETHALADQFTKLGERATVGAKQARQLGEYFGGKDVATEVAAATGRSIAQIQQELKKNQLPTDQLIRGLRQAQLELADVGKAGDAAKKAAEHDLGDQIQRLKNIVGDFGETLAKDLFGGDDLADSLHRFGDELKALLGSADVQATLKSVATAMKEIAVVGGGVALFAIKALAASFTFLADHQALVIGAVAGIGAVVLATVVPAFAAWAIATLAATWPLLAIGAAVGLITVGIYELVKHWDQVWGTLVSGFVAIVDPLNRALDWVIALPGKFYDAGKQVVQGLIDGITSLASGPLDAIRKMGTGVVSAFKAVLGIHSPSLVMQVQGRQVIAGATQGIDDATPQAEQASARAGSTVAQAFAASQMAAGAAQASAAPASQAGDSISYFDFVFNMGGNGSSLSRDELSAAVRDGVEEAIRLKLSRAQATT